MTPQEATVKLKDLGWTDRRMAELTNSSTSTINRIRLGQAATVDFDMGMKLIAEAKKQARRAEKMAHGND